MFKIKFLIPTIQDLPLVSGTVDFMFCRINLKLNYSDNTFNYAIDLSTPEIIELRRLWHLILLRKMFTTTWKMNVIIKLFLHP